MMSSLSDSQIEFLDTLYDKTVSGELEWLTKNSDSYQARLDGFSIDVDRRPLGDIFHYVVWVFDTDLNLIDRIYDTDGQATKTNRDSPANYGELIKDVFLHIKQSTKGGKLQDVVKKLQAVGRDAPEPEVESGN